MLRKREMMGWSDILWYTVFNSTCRTLMGMHCLHASLHWRKPCLSILSCCNCQLPGLTLRGGPIIQAGPIRIFSKKWQADPGRVSISLPDKGTSLIESRREHKALKRPCEAWSSTAPRPGQVYPCSSRLLEPTDSLFCLSYYSLRWDSVTSNLKSWPIYSKNITDKAEYAQSGIKDRK